jgi:mercuric ion transport protein
VRIELIFDATCPNVDVARAQLAAALTQAGRPNVWIEWDRANPGAPSHVLRFASPTILVAGRDVAGPSALDAGAGCRLYRDSSGAAARAPTVPMILAALASAEAAG